MDRPQRNGHLGVNKIGKNIKKSPLHQPNFANGIISARPQPRPLVYNIRKNEFRSIVQQFTASPLRDSFPPPQDTLLDKIRPSALTQINRPHVPPPATAQPTHNLARPPPMHPLPHGSQPMIGHWDNYTAESPISVCMRYPQSSLRDSGPNGNEMQPSHEYQPHPPPQSHNHHSARFSGSASTVPILPSPRFNGPPQQMYSSSLPSPQFNGRGILPSPASQYLLQSPTAYQNFLSPRSPYPLLSPGVQYPPPFTPRSFTLSSMSRPGILGPGTFPQPPPASPGTSRVFPNI